MKLPYLIYKRIRVGLGLTFGFILMYGVLTSNINAGLVSIGIGFFLIHLFGDVYNDYCDYHEDIRNKRYDKLTVSKKLAPVRMRDFSFALLAVGLLILSAFNPALFVAGLYYGALLFAYSNHSIRLKRYHIKSYLLAATTVWPVIVFSLNYFFAESLTLLNALFVVFCMSQYLYIGCQKDSTDRKDDTNLFLVNKWGSAWAICAIASVIALLSFAGIIFSLVLVIPWAINLSAKVMNLAKIRDMSITRKTRGRIVLIEFLTPYFYVLGGL